MAMEIKKYQNLVKSERNIFFKSSFERAYQSFLELGYDKKDESFFEAHASEVVEKMREQRLRLGLTFEDEELTKAEEEVERLKNEKINLEVEVEKGFKYFTHKPLF